MPGIQMGNQIDMNTFRVTEMGAGVDPTDAVNLSQLQAAVSYGYAETVGDGSATSFVIDHGLDTTDVIVQVQEIATGIIVNTETEITDADTVTVEFGAAPSNGQYRVLVLPVRVP